MDDSFRRRIIVSSATMSEPLKDSYNRPIRDLRVSLTDRCNFRCFYCLPHGEPPIAPKEEMLSYEEIEYACDIFVELGIEKIRLTGGEPMMRRDIEQIIHKLSQLKEPMSDKLQFVVSRLIDKLKLGGQGLLQFRELVNDLLDVTPHHRLAAGQTNLFNTQLNEDVTGIFDLFV